MKKHSRLILVSVSMLFVLALMVSPALAAPNPFIGAWYSTDTDLSYQTLTIGGGPGGSFHVRYFDYGASVCGPGPGGETPYFTADARGVLTEDGNDLHGALQVYCQYSPPMALPYQSQFAYTYDSNTDTLTDIWGVVWYRK